MGAKGSAEAAAKLNADNWGHLEVCSTNKAENKFCSQLIISDRFKSMTWESIDSKCWDEICGWKSEK